MTSQIKRKYEKRRRAEQEQATRLRITKAAVELHGTVGPARTTVSELAKRAGVQRGTVYRHFPDEASLFEACSAHWATANPLPDFGPLLEIGDPARRLRSMLRALYGYYRGTETMLTNIYRDIEAMPALAEVSARRRAALAPLVDLLANGWSGGDAKLRAAAVALAIDFRTWRMLTHERGLTDDQAVELMVGAVAT
jgi:AcrR family transcriptional regulator